MDTNDPQPHIDMDEKLEAEIQEALGDMRVEDMLDYADKPKERGSGRDLKRGLVVSIQGDDVFIEFGPKSQGICPLSQFTEKPELGSHMEFMVDRFDQNDGILILSRKGSVAKADWEALAVGQIVEARCTGTNKGGLDMEVANHSAFMPAGQVDVRHIDDLGIFVGEKFPCEVIELDRQRARIVLSRRGPMEAEREARRKDLMTTLEVGATVPAVIRSIRDFGAFADIGGVDGLIHISDLSYKRVNHPSEVVTDGQEVQVKILKIDHASDPPRIGLGLKQTLEDPFQSQANALEVGATVSGRVTKLMDFGAFVELAPGVEGLIHISELSHERVNRVSSVVKPDEIVTVKVLSVDPGSRRIGLSLKAARSDEEAETFSRKEDPEIRRMRAMLGQKFGDNLKGGLG
jgi:small subunit ribosomal protein S1